jgi:hypothetical protein
VLGPEPGTGVAVGVRFPCGLPEGVSVRPCHT